jgi:hypothetical protein
MRRDPSGRIEEEDDDDSLDDGSGGGDGGGDVWDGGDGGDGGDGQDDPAPDPADMETDCDTLNELGVTPNSWGMMVNSMDADYQAGMENGFTTFNDNSGGDTYYIGSPCLLDDGTPSLDGLSFPDGVFNPYGFFYHSHPGGWDGINTQNGTHFSGLDVNVMRQWTNGQALVGTQNGLWLMNRNSAGDVTGETQLGGDQWWDADCF